MHNKNCPLRANDVPFQQKNKMQMWFTNKHSRYAVNNRMFINFLPQINNFPTQYYCGGKYPCNHNHVTKIVWQSNEVSFLQLCFNS